MIKKVVGLFWEGQQPDVHHPGGPDSAMVTNIFSEQLGAVKYFLFVRLRRDWTGHFSLRPTTQHPHIVTLIFSFFPLKQAKGFLNRDISPIPSLSIGKILVQHTLLLSFACLLNSLRLQFFPP